MNKYSKSFEAYLRNYVNLTQDEINSMTRNEVFDALLREEGYGHGLVIRDMIKNIYGIDLNQYEECTHD